MNDRFPDATPEELNASDAACIICREEMNTAKKLVCGHLFHVHCLRSWLERRHTCPICRALVIPNEGGTSTTHSRTGANRQGANLSNTSPQDQTGDAAGSGNISRQQKRVQAAAAAASIYQKSFVYPLPSSLTCEIDDSIPNNPATYSSFQLPVQAQGITPNPEDAWATNLQLSVTQLEAQKRTIQNQIEV
nr:ERAD-associated E3 ubiquitin-protein ligase HRD1B-like [Tanacetum cinerariifolium]